MIYVTSDLHGYPLERFRALLAKADFSEEDYLFILGDVIDRNHQGGVDTLKWLLYQPNAELLLGNHEAMLLSCAFLFDEITEASVNAVTARDMHLLSVWQRNGAEPTIRALRETDPETRADILDYLREAPLYETVSAGGRDYLLVHSGLGGYRADKRIGEYTEDDLLWTRPSLTDRYSDRFTTVLGHTPTGYYSPDHRGRMLRTDTWIDIDTGAASGLPPMLLRLDDLQPFYAESTE